MPPIFLNILPLFHNPEGRLPLRLNLTILRLNLAILGSTLPIFLTAFAIKSGQLIIFDIIIMVIIIIVVIIISVIIISVNILL